mmetsp:Transcript_4814/g.13666  ORF Transcript_4814/g.13666 Transcript_4814/m.13666 type:complete len:211 (+) Transcript_4814:367-999(+)
MEDVPPPTHTVRTSRFVLSVRAAPSHTPRTLHGTSQAMDLRRPVGRSPFVVQSALRNVDGHAARRRHRPRGIDGTPGGGDDDGDGDGGSAAIHQGHTRPRPHRDSGGRTHHARGGRLEPSPSHRSAGVSDPPSEGTIGGMRPPADDGGRTGVEDRRSGPIDRSGVAHVGVDARRHWRRGVLARIRRGRKNSGVGGGVRVLGRRRTTGLGR